MTIEKNRRFLKWGAVLLLFLITVPRFFDVYRTLAFNTVPHDDYASYLLFYAGLKPTRFSIPRQDTGFFRSFRLSPFLNWLLFTSFPTSTTLI
jgi:hypothetical protein